MLIWWFIVILLNRVTCFKKKPQDNQYSANIVLKTILKISRQKKSTFKKIESQQQKKKKDPKGKHRLKN